MNPLDDNPSSDASAPATEKNPPNAADANHRTEAPSTTLRHPAWSAIRAVVPIVLLFIIFRTTDWRELMDHARRADQTLLWSAFGLYQIAVLMQGWRWQVVAASDGGTWPTRRMQLVNYVSMFFDSFTPGKLGSDAYRVAAMHRPGRVHHLVMSLLALRLHGMAANIVLAAVTGTVVLTIKHGWLRAFLPAVVICGVLVTVASPLYHTVRRGTLHVKRTRTGLVSAAALQLQRAHDAIRDIFSDRRVRRVSNVLVIVYMMMLVSVYWLVGRSFGMTLPFSSYLAVTPLLILASVIPVSIQGRGLTEAVAIGLWQGRRATQEQILLTCLTVFGIMVVQGLIGGVIWVARRGKHVE